MLMMLNIFFMRLCAIRCTFEVRKVIHLKNLEAINPGMGRVQYTYLIGELEVFREEPERKTFLQKPKKEDREKRDS